MDLLSYAYPENILNRGILNHKFDCSSVQPQGGHGTELMVEKLQYCYSLVLRFFVSDYPSG